MDDDAQHYLLRKLCRQLEGSYLNVDLTNTVVRNLVYLGRQTWSVGEGTASTARVGTVTTSFRPLNWCVLMFVVLIVLSMLSMLSMLFLFFCFFVFQFLIILEAPTNNVHKRHAWVVVCGNLF